MFVDSNAEAGLEWQRSATCLTSHDGGPEITLVMHWYW